MRKFMVFLPLIALMMSGCVSTQSEVFTIGFLPSEQASELTPKAEVLAEFLEERLDMEVEVVIPTAYEPLIEGLRFGHIDASYMDSGPGWLAHKKADAEVVLAELKKGSPFYYGEVYARADSEVDSLESALGKRIAFTSWTGSSGFIFPIGSLVDRGLITPEGSDFASLESAIAQNFEEYTVAGGYKQALDLLIQGKVDVAAGAHDAAERFLEEADRDKIKSVERLGKVPSHPVMVRKDLDDDLQARFVQAMLELNNENHQYIIQDLYGVDGLVQTDTQSHLGDFGPAFESLTGIQEKVLNKHKK